jgi:flagellar basal body L-ring protein FlgH
MLGALSVFALIATIAASLSAQAPVTAAPPSARPVADTSAPARRNFNWLSDKRAFGVGDILKVNVDEYALATANKGSTSDAARERKMGVEINPPSMGAQHSRRSTAASAAVTLDDPTRTAQRPTARATLASSRFV